MLVCVACLQLASRLTLVHPVKGNTVRVLRGDGSASAEACVGRKALVFGRDGEDAILRLLHADGSEARDDQVHILPLRNLGVVVEG